MLGGGGFEPGLKQVINVWSGSGELVKGLVKGPALIIDKFKNP